MHPAATADLLRSGVTSIEAERAGMFDVDNASLVYPEFKPIEGIIIPYFDSARHLMTFDRGPFCRVRYLGQAQQNGFAYAKPLRYGQPKGSGTRAYFAPIVPWAEILSDPTEPLCITEGEKKALAGVLAGFPVVGLGGVSNFLKDGELLPELASAAWRGRDVYICFDSDAQLNPNILAAEARLVDELQRKRGARCYLVRIPQDGEAKVGLDDYLLSFGAAGLVALLTNSPSLGALDAKIVALNKSVAWIERENLVYDLEDRSFIPKDSFITGSRFSSLKHITVGAKQRAQPKEVSVAQKWLTHPHAQRFSEVLFRPGEGVTIQSDAGRPALNLWNGFEPGEGDIKPFLELSDFLFSNMEPQHRDLPLRLMAYKAQHPAEKVPLAVVLVGPQGCGKTLWGECIRDAFAPYSVDVTSKAFHSEFQGWLERSLIAIINEAEHEDMLKGGDVLKSLISDLKRPMNEKYRPARQINTYTMYILTSNSRAVGAFSPDDRRMIVVDCPAKREREFYDRVSEWKRSGGAKALLGWLLHYDLKGWIPPASAPMTAEKYMSYVESLSPVQRLAEEMRTTTNESQIKLWYDQATAWARVNELSSNASLAAAARATLEGCAHTQIRDWYTPHELALMFPSIAQSSLGEKYDRSTPAGKISRELREAGVPYLVCADDPRGFRWRGVVQQYLVVANFDDWSEPLRQVDFERAMQSWPSYGSLRR
jgi:hypothetical protein